MRGWLGKRKLGASLGLSLGLFLLRPVAADAQPLGSPAYQGECRKLTRQMAQYAEVADRARERGNETWENATIDHIVRLSERRARLCPEYAGKTTVVDFREVLKTAGKIALKLFTMGMI